MRLLFKKNYLNQIENLVKGENHLFRNFFVEKNGEIKDLTENGKNSCAMVVSYLLYSFNSILEFLGKSRWIKFIHLTVVSTLKDMEENGWYEITTLKPGAVIVWEKKKGQNDSIPHHHIGFYVGDEQAISNDSRGIGFPRKHHYTYNNARKIEKIYWHKELDSD